MPGEKALRKNETLYTPWLYACHSADGLNGMSQQYHRFLRDEIIRFPEQKPRPVHLNTWEGIYFNHNPDYIMQMAERAEHWALNVSLLMMAGLKDVTMTARLWATGIPMNRNTRTG